jgi:hypothetical protein
VWLDPYLVTIGKGSKAETGPPSVPPAPVMPTKDLSPRAILSRQEAFGRERSTIGKASGLEARFTTKFKSRHETGRSSRDFVSITAPIETGEKSRVRLMATPSPIASTTCEKCKRSSLGISSDLPLRARILKETVN